MGRIAIICILMFFNASRADEFLVRIKNFPVGMNSFIQKIEAQGVWIEKIYELVPGLMRVSGSPATLNYLRSQVEVQYVEENHRRRPAITSRATPVPPLVTRPEIPAFVPRPTEWIKNGGDTRNFGLYQSTTKNVFEKRKFYGSEKTIIAVIDTGVDYTHPDLVANLWRNPGETGADEHGSLKDSNGVDDDGNGFVDDVVGWDFFNKDRLPYDDYGHGTHVAGIAAAVGGNGFGISGHCPRCSIMCLKFIGANGEGSDADAIDAIEYATLMGATVINSSWGGHEFDRALYDTFVESSRLGVIHAVAAGNEGVDLGMGTPHTYPAMFKVPGQQTVAALYEVQNFIPNWSNHGPKYVQFSMAGAEVYSTYPGKRYDRMSGTSMAAPGAAGILGLMKSYRPHLTFEQIDFVLKKTTITDFNHLDWTTYAGHPNVEKAFNLIDKLPAGLELD